MGNKCGTVVADSTRVLEGLNAEVKNSTAKKEEILQLLQKLTEEKNANQGVDSDTIDTMKTQIATIFEQLNTARDAGLESMQRMESKFEGELKQANEELEKGILEHVEQSNQELELEFDKKLKEANEKRESEIQEQIKASNKELESKFEGKLKERETDINELKDQLAEIKKQIEGSKSEEVPKQSKEERQEEINEQIDKLRQELKLEFEDKLKQARETEISGLKSQLTTAKEQIEGLKVEDKLEAAKGEMKTAIGEQIKESNEKLEESLTKKIDENQKLALGDLDGVKEEVAEIKTKVDGYEDRFKKVEEQIAPKPEPTAAPSGVTQFGAELHRMVEARKRELGEKYGTRSVLVGQFGAVPDMGNAAIGAAVNPYLIA